MHKTGSRFSDRTAHSRYQGPLSLTAALLLAMVVPAVAAPNVPPEVVKAAEARIAAAEQRAQRCEQLAKRGLASSEQVSTALRMWFIANREAPLSPAKLAEAAKVYRDKVAERLKAAEVRYKSGAFSEADIAGVRYDLAEAEFWLEEAKWKASGKSD